ncbi:tetratricopeptide repeat protein [Novosphingobium tardum]|uniref:Tetratricopeptide repeat protein n=1 Tax=Novosphingobium tardum TaxID=1538021 RepID=A0ABV8RML3_9SPHN
MTGGPALAQGTPGDDDFSSVSRPVVQSAPSGGSYALNAALGRLARNPSDVAALIDAGNAALSMGDFDAALGFLGRADQLSPGNPRVKTTLASAYIRNENPYDAIRLFNEAERAGANTAALAGDRGLAYDLVGDNVSAQRFYRQALAVAPSEEVVRRLALSQAIAGDRKGAEATLLSQVQRRLPAAWRTRAFMMAILGDEREAEAIAQGTMLPTMAQAIIPYLRYMPRLTPAQQAAAGNFGHFPRAAEIGRDDPRAVQYALANPQVRTGRGADAGLIPAGEPLGARNGGKKPKEDKASRRRRAEQERAAAADVRVAPGARSARSLPPQVAMATPAPAFQGPVYEPAVRPQPVSPPPVRVAAATPVPVQPRVAPPTSNPLPATRPVIAPAPTNGAPPSAFEQARLAQEASARPAQPVSQQPAAIQAVIPAPAPVAATAPARPALADLFNDFRPPAAEQSRSANVVDIFKLPPTQARPVAKAAPAGREPPPEAIVATKQTQPAAATVGKGKNAKAAPPPKPAAPSHPSRIWVQVATGRDKAALAFDWRKLTRQEPEAFKGRKSFTTPWGQANRLLTGPFESQAAAQAFLKLLDKNKIDAFLWTSPAGQAVDTLPIK